jgi:hypothetical protein
MNHSPAPRQLGRFRTILRTLSLLLLHPTLSPGLTDAPPRSRLPLKHDANGLAIQEISSGPYLKVIGAVPLRFGAKPPPPDLTTRPPAGAPPIPAPEQTPVVASPEAVPEANHPPATPEQKAAPAEVPSASTGPDQTSAAPLTILPDDTRPAPRPEDFLPFFQFPGNNPGSSVRAPGPLPPSSATYQQK